MSYVGSIYGKRFGKLVLVEFKEKRNKVNYYRCLCDCGKEKITPLGSLTSGKTISCGCIKLDKLYVNIFDNIGFRSGRLVVSSFSHKDDDYTHYNCTCDCNKKVVIPIEQLKRTKGGVKSCGCLLTDKNKEKLKDLSGQKFGKILVLGFIGFQKTHSKFECICDCGKKLETVGRYLVEGSKKSCGCLVKETNQKKRKPLTNHRKASLSIKNCHRKQLVKALRQKLEYVEDLGCSVSELREYLEKLFTPGMTWGNWSRTGWHIDHIRPLHSFDLNDPEQRKIAFHYLNLQPLWALDNIKKGHKY